MKSVMVCYHINTSKENPDDDNQKNRNALDKVITDAMKNFGYRRIGQGYNLAFMERDIEFEKIERG
jgi:hypothetical protein